MDSAIITPIRLIRAIDREFTTGFHVCYADLVSYSESYRDFYKEKSLRGEFIVLQYSSVEPRYLTSEFSALGTIRAAIEYVRPSVSILPYSDLGLNLTIKSAELATVYLRSFLGNVPLMGMIQGSSRRELIQCLEKYSELKLQSIGLPAVINNIVSRKDFIEEFIKDVPEWENTPVYLADIWDSFNEITSITGNGLHSLVMGGWSTLPVRLAYADRELKLKGKIRPDPPPLDFLDEHIPDLIIANLEDYIDIYTGRIE